jgi:hypothetical protein
MTLRLPLLSLLLLSVAAPVPAQETATAPAADDGGEVQVVAVDGLKNPEWRTYRQMLKGVAAFEKLHALAPDAPLQFQLRANRPEVTLSDVTLKLVGSGGSQPIAVAANGAFTLPTDAAAADDNAELVLNKKKDALRWRPRIVTPGQPDNERRMGDMRLECEVVWATERETMGFMARNALSLGGGLCHTSLVSVGMGISGDNNGLRLVATALLIEGGRSLKLRVARDGRGFFPPLHDSAWSDAARVIVTWVTPPAPAA